ncbi:MAG: zinc ribbon domain-containing protein [Verrucomicrobiales bacterium]
MAIALMASPAYLAPTIDHQAMPIYEYISVESENTCRICSKGFELRRPVDRPALEVCPLCRKPVKKLISQINTPKITKPMSVTDAKKAGFQILKRRDKGVYEKL